MGVIRIDILSERRHSGTLPIRYGARRYPSPVLDDRTEGLIRCTTGIVLGADSTYELCVIYTLNYARGSTPLARVTGCALPKGSAARRGKGYTPPDSRSPLVRSTQPTPVREAQPLRGARSATPSGSAKRNPFGEREAQPLRGARSATPSGSAVPFPVGDRDAQPLRGARSLSP